MTDDELKVFLDKVNKETNYKISIANPEAIDIAQKRVAKLAVELYNRGR